MFKNSVGRENVIRDQIVKLKFQCARIARIGFTGIIYRLAKKIFSFVLALLLSPISVVLFLLNYRRVMFFTDRIGHLAIEPDTLLKAQKLGLIAPKRWIVLAPPKRVANEHLLGYWSQYFKIYSSPLVCFILNSIFFWPPLKFDVSHFINRDNAAEISYAVNTQWGDSGPLLQLTKQDHVYAEEQLRQLGLPPGAWFVCVHARDDGFSPADERLQKHRNSKIEHLYPSIKEIIKRGGWVIRIGDPTQVKLPVINQVIDYAHHLLRNPRLDIILCAKAKFILGNTSGIFIVASVFDVPCALANMIPFPTLGFIAKDISISKLYRDPKSNRYLNFKEIMSSPLSTYRYAELYEKSGLIIEENSPEDILALTIEMLDSLENKLNPTQEDVVRQRNYLSLLTPKHYSYGACSKLSYAFLKKYEYLLA